MPEEFLDGMQYRLLNQERDSSVHARNLVAAIVVIAVFCIGFGIGCVAAHL